MIIKKHKNLLTGLIFLVLPTIFISFPLLDFIQDHYSLLTLDSLLLTAVFSGAMSIAYILHGSRLRFFLVFGGLLTALYFIYQSIAIFPFSEFDAYYMANRFKIIGAIFALGWFVGYGIARWRYFLIFFSLVVIAISVTAVASLGESNATTLVWLIAPPVIYCFYVLFIKELLNDIRLQQKTNYAKILLRVGGFGVLIFLLFWISTLTLQSKFEAFEEQIAQQQEQSGGGEDDDSMLRKDNDDLFEMKDYAQLRPRLKQYNEHLFTAYIDNFIAEDVANPQYITLYHLNRYNVGLERFEVDPDGPANDLFLPDPSIIPNYFMEFDTSVLRHDKMEKSITDVQSTIYIKQLDPSVFVAPSTAYSVQPIAIEDSYKKEYKLAYNVNSEVSRLNSAYFVYNSENPQLRQFQESRFAILQDVKSYAQEDSAFMAYYTQVPVGSIFDSIDSLAREITKNAKTPIDKVISIRDYFLSDDENGEPLFTYTLTPGKPTDPNIPDQSLLNNFLFNTHRGYCTYFASATFFMLRSLGVPARMAVGFLTIDRSHSNPGWYWFYADQAHAWTQVYFPEYGWLDFDTTISTEDAEETEQPDQTPPVPPLSPQFVTKGVVREIMADKKLILESRAFMAKGDMLELDTHRTFLLDAQKAKLMSGERVLDFEQLSEGDTALVVSFDRAIQKLRDQRNGETNDQFADRLPEPIEVSEIYLELQEPEVVAEEEDQSFDYAGFINQAVRNMLGLVVLLLVILWIAPSVHYAILRSSVRRSADEQSLSIASYKAAHFLLNQLGIGRGSVTPLQYATDTVDPTFETRMGPFIQAFHKIKYGQEALSTEEKSEINHFYQHLEKKVNEKYSTGKRFFSFLMPNRWISFLINLNLSKS